jgi:predicted metalloprotease
MESAMRLDDFRSSDNVEDRRGTGGGMPIGRGGLGIVGLVVVLLISYFTGINPATLIGGYDAVTGGNRETSAPGQAGAPSDESGRFVSQVLGSTEDTWTEIFQEQVGTTYQKPRLVLFSGGTNSACGMAQSAMGPFYCPNDRRVYLDTRFFDEMRTRFNACPADRGACAFAQAYVIAHEIGHHVQNLLGILPKVNQVRESASEAEANALSVRVELQADCLAGVWANRTEQRFKFIEAGDIEAALQTANAIGDDMLQKRSQGYVVPDSFTHGSSAQRQRWFTMGLQTGKVASCNTFSARQI